MNSEIEYEVQRKSAGIWEAGYWDKHLPSFEAAQGHMEELAEYAARDGFECMPMRVVRVTREVVSGESA